MAPLSDKDLEDLKEARQLLENPGLASRLANMVGTPIEKGMELLPANFSVKIEKATRVAIQKALSIAVDTMDRGVLEPSRDIWHKMAVGATGAAGGAFGLAALVIELPVSTTIMLRSIADIARSHGEDLNSLEARLACLEVLALGGRSSEDDASESGYFMVRTALAKAVSDAVRHIAKAGLANGGAPALVRLISLTAQRFGIVVTEKAASIAIPVVGSVGGAVVNTLFMDHFQDVAHGHFTIRRLERKHGEDLVKREYEKLPKP